MHEYDIALKSILTRPDASLVTMLTGQRVVRWHNSELPEVRTLRADLLGETSDGVPVQVELQSTNHPRMALRMLEYSVAIHRVRDRFPEQVVLYVGEAPLKMERRATGPGLSYECRIVDIRELDAEPLLTSASLEDNVVGILARVSDGREAVRRILSRVAVVEPSQRRQAIAELLILSALRSLGREVEKEIERMPILNDIMDHEVFGPKLRSAMADGLQQGRIEGERSLLLGMIRKRYGSVPDWTRQRLESLSGDALEQLSLRLLDAPTLEDLFQ